MTPPGPNILLACMGNADLVLRGYPSLWFLVNSIVLFLTIGKFQVLVSGVLSLETQGDLVDVFLISELEEMRGCSVLPLSIG